MELSQSVHVWDGWVVLLYLHKLDLKYNLLSRKLRILSDVLSIGPH